ncbi:helix-turn-helix transcriptional regulator [Nitrospirillum amazonense]|uniref:helix-turn-helix transcriptional regulator n=1 Tax=Nitrospirillum amazonense TaxID=28077 RepID=UPI002412D511|nr:helix-turn-helix domain-containing protein [Nitrospirillum amazonense]MDG3439490.1 helix-turn-helix transcriptional regulator [Nitrospirillum amazonense]
MQTSPEKAKVVEETQIGVPRRWILCIPKRLFGSAAVRLILNPLAKLQLIPPCHAGRFAVRTPLMSAKQYQQAVNFEQARQQLSDRPLRATSAGRLWEGISLDEYADYYMDGSQFMPPRDHHIVTVSLGRSSDVLQERLGKTFESPSLFGEATMMPAGYETRFRGLLPRHIRIGLMPEQLIEAADACRRIGTASKPRFLSNFRVRDPWLVHMGEMLSLELGRAPHPAQDLLIESLSVALSVHLVRGYSADVHESAPPAAMLSSAAMRRAFAYVEDRGMEKISLAELAEAAGVNRFHLVKIFKKEVGMSPMRYLERLRIERAKELIRAAELPLADIAYAVGFSDQSHFTRRFRHHVGCTPAAYARENGRRFLPVNSN